MDRVYLSSPNIIAVLDHERKRTYIIRKEGLPDVDKKSYDDAMVSSFMVICIHDVSLCLQLCGIHGRRNQSQWQTLVMKSTNMCFVLMDQ